MKIHTVCSIMLAGTALLLAGCSGPESPQEVAQAFWEAAVEGDSRAAARYSTLATAQDYDRLAEDWPDFPPAWGKVVIDGEQASVETTFVAPQAERDASGHTFTTYLVHRDDAWVVDYERTATSLSGGVLGDLFRAFDQLGREFSRQFNRSAEEANEQIDQQLEQLLGELERAQEKLEKQASKAMEAYAEELNRALKEIDESIQRALEDSRKELSEEDRRLLHSASRDLQQGQASIQDASLASLVDGDRQLNDARHKLAAVNSESLASYQRQWQELFERLAEDIADIQDAFAGQAQ